MVEARKTALVTGASSGIGVELARLFAAGGHDLVLVARSADRLRELADELGRRHGVAARVIARDLALPESAPAILRDLAEAGVAVDVLVNNAGFATYGLFQDLPLEPELAEIQVNVATLTALTKLLLPPMLAKRSGRILNVASTAAFLSGPLMAVYYATKAYVLSFSEALAQELSGTGVSVTALCPGPTATGFQQRAAMEESQLFQRTAVMDAATVAAAGYKGLMAGRRIVIPGLLNKLLAQSGRVSPRRLTTAVVQWTQERRRG